jgi:hypothetical protein
MKYSGRTNTVLDRMGSLPTMGVVNVDVNVVA